MTEVAAQRVDHPRGRVAAVQCEHMEAGHALVQQLAALFDGIVDAGRLLPVRTIANSPSGCAPATST